MKRLYALRGAAQCENSIADICGQITLMYDELLSANKLDENEIVSVIFSVTDDLTAANPCTALRKSGRAGELSLFSVQEPNTQGMLERTVRVIIHCYLEEGFKVSHVYRNGAEVLRPDRVK
uniref:chorismate mutase n=1 Tax=uncultured bacterium contig00060 TaxID=1181543 RepID=A0A806K0H7_9BACT|nr:chorismate mutase [uncultured bacterium contig00060]